MCNQWELVELAKKIQKIEDKDDNYRENKNWLKFRKRQEDIWNKMRKNNEMEM